MIFQENWKAIYGQFEPFATVLSGIDTGTIDEAMGTYENAIATISPYFTKGKVVV